MFIPNTVARYSRRLGHDKFGQPQWSNPVSIPCAVVRLSNDIAKTSVRTDSSASRGAAEEKTIEAVILLGGRIVPTDGHRLEIAGRKLQAIKIEPRYNVMGELDHYECGYEITA